MVNGPSPGPAPAAQARASNSRLRKVPVQLADVAQGAPTEAAQEGAQSLPSRKRGATNRWMAP